MRWMARSAHPSKSGRERAWSSRCRARSGRERIAVAGATAQTLYAPAAAVACAALGLGRAPLDVPFSRPCSSGVASTKPGNAQAPDAEGPGGPGHTRGTRTNGVCRRRRSLAPALRSVSRSSWQAKLCSSSTLRRCVPEHAASLLALLSFLMRGHGIGCAALVLVTWPARCGRAG
jgi:hypothetical protein